jgi:N-carbamoyl-L-amino-acid hydrolase
VLDAAQSDSTRATFGRIEVTPNSTNAIPSLVTAWLDARAATDGALESVVASAGSDVTMTAESVTRRVEFDPDLRDRLAGLLGGVPQLPTAAGHDAGVLSEAGVSSAMLFVRNPTGVSHSPAEHANAEDCIAGTESLARVLTDLGGFH